MTPQQKLEQFRADLPGLNSNQIIQKYLIEGDCVALSDEQHAQIRNITAERFGIEPAHVILVGSAKLGFTLKPAFRYRFFGDHSDIDITVISSALFETVWQEAFDFERSGAYWPKKDEFISYLFRGWIRPDMLPPQRSFPFTQAWWDFFNQMTATRRFGPYKVRGGLYRSRHYFDSYQRVCVDQCKQIIGI